MTRRDFNAGKVSKVLSSLGLFLSVCARTAALNPGLSRQIRAVKGRLSTSASRLRP
jgi:hypothetical protein